MWLRKKFRGECQCATASCPCIKLCCLFLKSEAFEYIYSLPLPLGWWEQSVGRLWCPDIPSSSYLTIGKPFSRMQAFVLDIVKFLIGLTYSIGQLWLHTCHFIALAVRDTGKISVMTTNYLRQKVHCYIIISNSRKFISGINAYFLLGGLIQNVNISYKSENWLVFYFKL